MMRRSRFTGSGGIGKTTVAKQYAWDARDRYHGLWWVRAESRDALLDDLIALGRRLRLDFDEKKPEEAALATLDHIAQTPKAKPWLMVYDNVEDKALVRRFTPAENAHFILTTRLPDWLGEAEDLPVDVFPRETAIDYLLAGVPQATREAAGRLADALGCLPLALAHARAFCRARGKSFEAYAGELATRLDTLPKDAAADYPRSVFATFSLAMDRASEDCPAAARLMGLLAYVAPDQIPLWLIPETVMPEEERDEALDALARLSLVAREPLADGTPAVSVHRLVQAVMRKRLQQAGEAAANAAQAVTLIDGGFAANDGTMEVERRRAAWLPHALAVLDHAPRDGAAAHDTVWVCNYIGDFRVSRGDLARARQAYDMGLTIAERLAAAEPGHAGWQRDLAASRYQRWRCAGRRRASWTPRSAPIAPAWRYAERLAAAEPGHAGWQRDLSVAHNKVGDVLSAQGQLAASRSAPIAHRWRSLERLAAAEPGHAGWQRDLSVAHNKVGDVLSAQGELAAALGAYRAGLAIRRAAGGGGAVATRPAARFGGVAHQRRRCAGGAGRAGRRAGRLSRGPGDRRAAGGGDPGNAGWQRDLSVATRRSAMCWAQGRAADALGAYRAGLAIRERLAAAIRATPAGSATCR